jgi:bacterioferritin (cytochrome b1)
MEEILAKEEEHAEDLKTLIQQLGAAVQKPGQKPDIAA